MKKKRKVERHIMKEIHMEAQILHGLKNERVLCADFGKSAGRLLLYELADIRGADRQQLLPALHWVPSQPLGCSLNLLRC